MTDASLQVGAGEIHALIGPNGAGKTTLFNLVSGLFPTDSGTIKLNGREIQGVPSEAICHQGLARSFQITNLFKGLSIYENLRLSLQAQNAGPLQPLARHRPLRGNPRRDRGADQIPRPRGDRDHRGRRTVLWRAAAGRSRHRARLQAAGAAAGRAAGGTRRRRARARVEPRQEHRRQYSGPDRRARHRPRARLLAHRHRDEPGRGADDRHAGRGARRSARAADLHRHRRSRGRAQPQRSVSARAPSRCCASSASTRFTARATSCTTPRSTCARARSSPCSAATAPASRRC